MDWSIDANELILRGLYCETINRCQWTDPKGFILWNNKTTEYQNNSLKTTFGSMKRCSTYLIEYWQNTLLTEEQAWKNIKSFTLSIFKLLVTEMTYLQQWWKVDHCFCAYSFWEISINSKQWNRNDEIGMKIWLHVESSFNICMSFSLNDKYRVAGNKCEPLLLQPETMKTHLGWACPPWLTDRPTFPSLAQLICSCNCKIVA
jgi:hypothetical protein